MKRLKYLCEVNPSIPKKIKDNLELQVSFYPMESVPQVGLRTPGPQEKALGDVIKGYTYFANNDIVFAKVTPCLENGKMAQMNRLINGIGFGSTELIVLRSKPGQCHPQYLKYVINSDSFRNHAISQMYGAGGLKRVSEDAVKNFFIAITDQQEQRQIAAYLNRETAKIDSLMSKQKKLIALLKEKRQAVICQAVTKGVDPYAEMKDSGVEWLGRVPAHWNVRPLKAVGTFYGGAGFPHEYQGQPEEEIPFFKVNSLSRSVDGFLVRQGDSITKDTARLLRAKIFPKDTIVFAKVGAALLLGRVRRLKDEGCLDNNMMGLILNFGNDPSFFSHILSLVRFDSLCNPGAVPSINEKQIRSFVVAYPPSLEEQILISNHLCVLTKSIDNTISKCKKSIGLLGELRQALITAAVAGKIDVRNLVTEEDIAALDADVEQDDFDIDGDVEDLGEPVLASAEE